MRGAWSVSVVLLAMGGGVSCASLPPCPHRGGPDWRQYVTSHFDVRTDLRPADAERVVRDLEEMRATMLATAWSRDDEPHDRTQVVVLASRSALQVFAGVAEGLFVRRSPLPSTVLFAGKSVSTETPLRHELAHDLSHWFLPVQPDWLSEGTATYLETARYDHDSRRAYIGEVPLRRIRGIWNGGMFDIARLLEQPAPDDPVGLGSFEDTSWLLFHYLISTRRGAFVRYLGRLKALQPSREAWKAELPDLDPSKLTKTLAEHSRSGNFNWGFRTIAPWERDVRIRSMSDAEVHGVRAYLYSSFQGPGVTANDRAAAAELEDAFRQDRPPIEALAVAFYVYGEWHGGTRATLAAQAVAAHPDSVLAWLMVADSTSMADPACRTALVRALAREPHNRSALERLALLTAHQGHWEEALALSSRALDHGSVRADLRLAHLQALAMTGQCAEAEVWADVLASLGPKQPTGLSARWSQWKAACVPAPPQSRAPAHAGEGG